MIDLYKYTEKEQKEILNSMTVVYDSKEKENGHILATLSKLGISHTRRGLPYGDYTVEIPANKEFGIFKDLYFYDKIIIERKNSLEELSSCFTETRDRLKKEFALAPEHKVMIVENASYTDMVLGNYNTQYNKKSFWASYHSFWHEFNLPIVFLPDKKYTGLFIIGYFRYYLRQILK